MTELSKTAFDLPRLILDSYRDEYRDLSETWRNLDTKAQGLGAIAGIFMAAVFAWVRDLPASFGMLERAVVIITLMLLVCAVVAAVLALQVRKVASPPFGDETAEMVRDILRKQKDGELEERLARLSNDQANTWRQTNKDMQQHCDRKACWLSVGQIALLLAAACVTGLSLKAILNAA
jgi:predicted PurR-regulated permease PerM